MPAALVHGESGVNGGTPEYIAWRNMKGRCSAPRHPAYKRYGARGIQVCERWRSSFANFLADVGRRPSPKHSIDRIDNSGNYEPDNCRWATSREQARNTKRNRLIEWDGRLMCIAAWAQEMGVKANILYNRFSQRWPLEKVMTQPVLSRKNTEVPSV